MAVRFSVEGPAHGETVWHNSGMTDTAPKERLSGSDEPEANSPESSDPTATHDADKADRPREIGGRKGPDPTRYGDWEKNGRCIDF
jgi:hypothetical protein